MQEVLDSGTEQIIAFFLSSDNNVQYIDLLVQLFQNEPGQYSEKIGPQRLTGESKRPTGSNTKFEVNGGHVTSNGQRQVGIIVDSRDVFSCIVSLYLLCLFSVTATSSMLCD